MCREFRGGQVTETAVGSLFVVLLQATRGEPAGRSQVFELLDVQQLVAESAEERFGEAVLPRGARLDVEHLQPDSFAVTTDGANHMPKIENSSGECGVLETVAVGRRATRAVSGVGEFCGRAELYDLAVELMNDRLRGTLIGLTVGDALGAAVEFQPPGTFEPVTGYRAGGPHGFAPGEWTDDTSMALWSGRRGVLGRVRRTVARCQKGLVRRDLIEGALQGIIV